jgi:hypothetical protein
MKKKRKEKIPHEEVKLKGKSHYNGEPVVKDKSKYEDYEEEKEEDITEL